MGRNKIRDSILLNFKHNKQIKIQSAISVSRGGLGMRHLKLVKAASSIFARINKDSQVDNCLFFQKASHLQRMQFRLETIKVVLFARILVVF